MKRNINFKILIFCLFLTLISMVISVLSSQKLNQTDQDLNQERYLRMVAEEKLEKSRNRVRQMEHQVERIRTEKESLESMRIKDQEKIDQLQLSLDKATRFNEVLQRELQNALVIPVND